MKKLLLLILVIVIPAAGCSKAENANNAGSNTYDASPVPEKTLSGIEESTSGNTDNAENDALDTSPESDTTLSDIIEASSVICAAGLGITLTAASTMVFYSLDYSMSNFEQTKARIHRVGQKNGCTYIYLIAKGTVDSKILTALRNKADLAKMLIDDYRKGANPFAPEGGESCEQ